jgi:hypothetical protein
MERSIHRENFLGEACEAAEIRGGIGILPIRHGLEACHRDS